jgi:hypothetical protein
MKRVLLTVAVALLIPSILMAAPVTLGVYIDGGLTYTPTQYEPFRAGLYIVQSDYYVTGVEYQLLKPDVFFVIESWEFPPNHALDLGNPLDGQSITYWPPLTGYPNGYDLLVSYNCRFLLPCYDAVEAPTGASNYMLGIGPDPSSGYLRGTYAPDNEFFDIIGLPTYICPEEGVGTEEESWGAIKSMYR